MDTVCDDYKVINKVIKDAGEDIIVVGKDNLFDADTVFAAVYLNNKTGSYTVVLIEKTTKKACVVSSGINGRLVLPTL